MKRILLLTLLCGFLAPLSTYGLVDTVSIHFTDISARRVWSFWERFGSSGNGEDTVLRGLKINHIFDTVLYYTDTIVFRNKWGRVFKIQYDDSYHTIKYLSYDDHNFTSLYRYDLTISASNIPVTEFDSTISFELSGAEILPINFYYHEYDLYDRPHEKNSEEMTSLPTYSATSSVKFSMNKQYLLSLPSLPARDNSVSLFPNPASNILTVRSKDVNNTVEVFDQLGREVHIPEISRTDESVTFNTSSLIPGIYWLRTGSQRQKIIIQR